MKEDKITEMSKYKLSLEEKFNIINSAIIAYNNYKLPVNQVEWPIPSAEMMKWERSGAVYFCERINTCWEKMLEEKNPFRSCFIEAWKEALVRRDFKFRYHSNRMSSSISHRFCFFGNSIAKGIEVGCGDPDTTCAGPRLFPGTVIGGVGGLVKGAYNFFSRSPLGKSQQYDVLYLLSLVKKEKLKDILIEEIIVQYNSRWHLVQSRSSADLSKLLAGQCSREKKYNKILEYMGKRDGDILYNNGKDLFNIVAEITFKLRGQITSPEPHSGLSLKS